MSYTANRATGVQWFIGPIALIMGLKENILKRENEGREHLFLGLR